VFGGSVAPARADRAGRPTHAGATPISTPGEGTPSQQSIALGDLSQGFGSPSDSLLVPRVTSPVGSAEPAGTPLTAGMILLGAGLMALFGSFMVAGLRRRRSSADSPWQQD